jgi:hypothetical protein
MKLNVTEINLAYQLSGIVDNIGVIECYYDNKTMKLLFSIDKDIIHILAR